MFKDAVTRISTVGANRYIHKIMNFILINSRFVTDKSISYYIPGIFITRVHYAKKVLRLPKHSTKFHKRTTKRCTHRRPVLNSFICSVVTSVKRNIGPWLFIRNRKVSFVLVAPRR